MIIERNRVIYDGGIRPIVYDVFFKENNIPKPVVIFCHGYKGFKDWGAWDLVAKAFAKAGFFFLKFNFSHNGGTVEQPVDFPDLKAFSENNYSIELEDVQRILTMLNLYNQHIDSSDINIIGHSRGGGLALLATEKYESIKRCITWAGVSDFSARFFEGTEAFELWKKDGITYVENARTKQQLPHQFSFYEDFDKNRETYRIERAVRNILKPLLILQGTNDHAVPMKEAENLKSWAPNAILHIIEGADHVFQTKHPWKEDILPKEMLEVIEETISFLNK